MSLPSQVCYYCEKPDPELECILDCKRSFHENCLRLRAWEHIDEKTIYCENCLLRIHRCSFCGIHSQIHSNFYKCSVPECNRFYHDDCSRKLKAVYGNEKLTTQQGKFKCPAHYSIRYKNEGAFISCVKNQTEQIAIKYRLSQFLEEAPPFIEKLHYEKLNTRGVKSIADMSQEEKVKKNQYEWCKLKQFECLSFNQSYIVKSRQLMKLVASNKDFIEKNIKAIKDEAPVENEETEDTERMYVRKAPTAMDLFVYSTSQYMMLKRDRKQLEKLGHSYKKMVKTSRRLAFKERRKN